MDGEVLEGKRAEIELDGAFEKGGRVERRQNKGVQRTRGGWFLCSSLVSTV